MTSILLVDRHAAASIKSAGDLDVSAADYLFPAELFAIGVPEERESEYGNVFPPGV